MANTPQLPNGLDDPFKRIVNLSLSERQMNTKDPRLLVPRAGYPEHARNDFNFWKSTKGDIHIQAPSYSEWKFCEGFNITAVDFYIIRRRLITLLYRDKLYQKRRKVEKKVVLDVEFEYAVVEEKISKHLLLQSKQAHPYWKNKMIADLITKTAAMMRDKQDQRADADGNALPGEFFIKPNYTYLDPSWVWGKEVEELKYEKREHMSVKHTSIIVRAYGSASAFGDTINLPKLVPNAHLVQKLGLQDTKFELLKKKVFELWKILEEDEEDYAIGYQNPYWGNEMLLIEDDKSLHIALKTLKIRGRKTVAFWFLDVGEGTDEDMEDDGNSSVASWKTDGYYTDDGIERQIHNVQKRIAGGEED